MQTEIIEVEDGGDGDAFVEILEANSRETISKWHLFKIIVIPGCHEIDTPDTTRTRSGI